MAELQSEFSKDRSIQDHVYNKTLIKKLEIGYSWVL